MMFEPPPGFIDLLGDADLHPTPSDPRYQDLEVPGVGVVSARRPLPAAVADVAVAFSAEGAAAVTPPPADLDAEARERWCGQIQDHYLTRFVQSHLAGGEHDRLLFDMMMLPDMPADTVIRVARALKTWGTPRPYRAVGMLCVVTGKHWRVLRQRITANGIADPLSLTSMHALLDFAETLVLQSFSSGDANKDRYDRERFQDALYKPEFTTPVAGARKGGVLVAPPGFDAASMEAAFDAAAAAL